jgi:hypothetical protein
MENKTSKYFKYAIGEIVLVVIGILIALQINNWNQTNQTKAKEIEVLKDLKKGLNYDILQMDSVFTQYERAKFSIHKILNHFKENRPYSDTLDAHFFNSTVVFDSGGLTNGVYETLKSFGLDLISNKDIRDLIISVYDEHHPWMHDWEKRYINLIFDAHKNIYNTRFEDFWNGDNNDPAVVGLMKPVNDNLLKTDKTYAYHLKSQLNLIGWLIEKPVKQTQNQCKKLLKLIDVELKDVK